MTWESNASVYSREASNIHFFLSLKSNKTDDEQISTVSINLLLINSHYYFDNTLLQVRCDSSRLKIILIKTLKDIDKTATGLQYSKSYALLCMSPAFLEK